MNLSVALQSQIPFPQHPTRNGQGPGSSLSCFGEGVDTRLPWPISATSSRPEIQSSHLHSANTEHTLRARECARCQDLKQRAGQVQSALPP